MRSFGRSLLSRRGRVLAPSTVQRRLNGLSCLELRKEIQDSARRNLRTTLVWEQYVQEVCKRIRNHEDKPKDPQADMFSPTDMSLIFSSFAAAKRRVPEFISYMLETTRSSINKYEIRDIAVLYNGLVKLGVQADDMIVSFNGTIEGKFKPKTSEKDISLLLNALLELGIKDIRGIVVKAALILSSRIRYISNCHTLTLLLYSYSRLGYLEQSSANGAFQVEAPQSKTTSAERSPETMLIQETTLSLLGRCAEMMMHMRSTDIMYYYRAGYNLIYASSEGVTRQLYASMVNLPKAHLRISEHLLEFETRELVTLLRTFVDHEKQAEEHPQVDGSALWAAQNEVRATMPALKELIITELVFRSKVVSFADGLAFLKIMGPDDHRDTLVYRRLAYKLNKLDDWDKFQKSQLWDLVHCLDRRTEKVTSKEAQELMVAIARNIPGTLKLKEVDLLLKLAARLGSKSNALLKKAISVHCRADCLLPSQASSMLFHLTALGYVEHLAPVIEACFKVESPEDALKVMVVFGILKVTGLMEPHEKLVERMIPLLHRAEDISQKGLLNELAFLRASGLSAGLPLQPKYKLIPRLHGGRAHITVRDAQLLSGNKLKFDYSKLSMEQCIATFANDLKEFIAKFDAGTRVHLEYELDDMVVPIVLELEDGTKAAMHVLMDDFYSGKRQMLRLDVYAQLRLMEQRGLRTVCCDIVQYLSDDKTQFLACLLERCSAPKGANELVETKPEKSGLVKRIGNLQPGLDSFSRLRALVAHDT